MDIIQNRLKELLLEKACELGLTIEKMEVMPYHVYLLVKAEPTDAPQSDRGVNAAVNIRKRV